MKTIIVYAHPWEGSFNHAVLDALKKGLEGQDFEVIDLYEDGFNPGYSAKELAIFGKGEYLDPLVGKYQRILDTADRIFFVFPTWWNTMPAILKGFFDKVFLKGWAYNDPIGPGNGLLGHIKDARIFVTMNTPGWLYKLIMKPVYTRYMGQWILRLCGVRKVKVYPLCSIYGISTEKRKEYLDKVERLAGK